MEQNKKSVLSTLIYSDIFDYPLKTTELEKYCIGKCTDIEKTLAALVRSKEIIHEHDLYCLRGRGEIIAKRLQRQKMSNKKLQLALQITKFLQIIPTIQLLGISGSLAMENAEEDEDIDIFVITKAGTIWTTRFFVLLLLQLIGKRRKWNDKHSRDSICANMFVDESNLMLPINKQNLFTAHEVIQMKPIFDRNNTYKKFLFSNQWIKQFLPSIHISRIVLPNYQKHNSWIEKMFKTFQMWYMHRHRTTEYITDTILAFHPENQEKRVLDELRKKLKTYAL